MKKNITIAEILAIAFLVANVSLQAWGQEYTSHNNYTGIWQEAATWPSTPGIPATTIDQKRIVTINGYVTQSGNLTVHGNSAVSYGTLVVNDTLWVTGDLIITDKGRVRVEPGGVLVVAGNISMNDFSQLENNGRVVGKENMMMADKSSVDNNNDFYIFGTVTNNSRNNGTGDIKNEKALINNDPSLYEFTRSNTVLPIELLFFQSAVVAGTVQLDWATTMEENFDYFTLERAGEDASFEAIAEIKGKGSGTEEVNYHFLDKNPLAGLNLYRLKATDFDGSVEYHHIISAWIEKKKTSDDIKVYPNPVKGNEQLFISTNSQHHLDVSISDLLGNVILKTVINHGTHQIELPQQLKPGTYLVLIKQADGHRQYIRLLKH